MNISFINNNVINITNTSSIAAYFLQQAISKMHAIKARIEHQGICDHDLFHSCYNQPRVGRLKFRLKTNSTVAWLYAGGVSLILPDVQFGAVSQDWVTFIVPTISHKKLH